MKYGLREEEIRVLGCLMEKKMTTPEYYPLTLNSLIQACNQKTNRDPVVSYNEETVLNALEGLKKRQLVLQSHISRVVKYSENLITDSKIILKEAAALCVLFVRGAQTPGEIKTRTERMCEFKSLEEIFDLLKELEELEFVRHLPRKPGQKEARYCHLFSCSKKEEKETVEEKIPKKAVDSEKLLKLEEEVKLLRQELENLREEFRDFKNQF